MAKLISEFYNETDKFEEYMDNDEEPRIVSDIEHSVDFTGKLLKQKPEYDKMINNGYNNIYYVESDNALGLDQEGTVDSVHFTDLGFIRYADFLLEKFEEFNIIE